MKNHVLHGCATSKSLLTDWLIDYMYLSLQYEKCIGQHLHQPCHQPTWKQTMENWKKNKKYINSNYNNIHLSLIFSLHTLQDRSLTTGWQTCGKPDSYMAKSLGCDTNSSFTSTSLVECDYLFRICHHHVHIWTGKNTRQIILKSKT